MGRSNNVNRPFVRKRRSTGTATAHTSLSQEHTSQDALLRPSGLLSSAGLAQSASFAERATIDQLERRQMLFSLTVTADDVDPNTGLGTVRGAFAYATPYLNTTIDVTDVTDQTQVEGFDQAGYGPIASGQVFVQSALQFVHNINPATDIAVSGVPQTQENQDRFVRVNLNETGEFFALRFFTNGQDPTERIAVSNVSMTISPDRQAVGGDNTGFLTNLMSVQLRFDGNIVQTFTGAALRALITGNPNLGTGQFSVDADPINQAFDEIRFVMNQSVPVNAGPPSFEIDNIAYTVPQNPYAAIVDSRGFGALFALTGPVGASITIRDLYGNDQLLTTSYQAVGGATVPPANRQPTGIIRVGQDGIGSIRFSGTDSRSSFVMVGGVLGYSETAPDGLNLTRPIPDFWWDAATGVTITIPDSPTGLLDELEQAGFGYAADVRDTTVEVTGLPPAPGSLIIGSPFVRDRTSEASYNAGGFALDAQGNPQFIVLDGFNRPEQGVFIEDGSSMGSITIDGIVHGSSRFTGFVDRINISLLMGSITVEGDLGSLVVGGDAGIWSPDPEFRFQDGRELDPNNKTNAQVIVGRTAGQVIIGGRSQLDVTVVGDVNSPTTRPARDYLVYNELEAYSGQDPTVNRRVGMASAWSLSEQYFQSPTAVVRANGTPLLLGDAFFRNDSLLAAEVISGPSSAVRIRGDLGAQDPHQGEDRSDVYAFAVDGTTLINIQGSIGSATSSLYFRIVDSDGVVVAAPSSAFRQGRFVATNLNWQPTSPGMYYLVVSDPTSDIPPAAGNQTAYTVNITGMAAATLGTYRTGGGSGFTDQTSGEGSSVNVLSGNIGSIRIGTGYLTGAGAEGDPTSVTNTVQTADDAMSWQGGSVSAPGNIYNITTGSDIGPPSGNTTGSPQITVTVGGDIGNIITGISPLLGGGADGGGRQGDVNFLTLNVGGRIGTMDIRGGVGIDQDPEGSNRRFETGPNALNIFTGLGGGNGNIGLIRIGFHVAGDSMNVTTPNNTTIGGVLVSQDAYTDADPRSGVFLGSEGIRFNTGSGSDVRFVDIPRIDLVASVNITYPLLGGNTVELIDDGGARVRITVDGPTGVAVGSIRALPVDGSQGVAIGQITADLTGGRTLRIEGTGGGSGIVSIGRLVVSGDGTSAISITGTTEIDIWRIQDGAGGDGGGAGGGFINISNETPNGDIVAIDISGLGELTVEGDLGRTQVPAWGPQTIGPRLGISLAANGTVGGPIGLPNGGGLFDDDLAANKINRAIADDNFNTGQAALEDVGSPVDPDLNGLIVRAGNVTTVRARGSIGDVIIQGAGSIIQTVTANFNNNSDPNRFRGIIGTVIAGNIGEVNIGDGLLAPEPSPFSTTGIFAINNLGTVTSLVTGKPIIVEGPINASNSVEDAPSAIAEGINEIQLTNARFKDAYIGTEQIDGFWKGFLYDDDNVSLGDMGSIRLTNTNFFRSDIRTGDLNELILTGTFDASRLNATGEVGDISATNYRNSTLLGTQDELRTNEITLARNVDRLQAVGGDMSDLTIDVVGSVLNEISAINISRSTINVDNEIERLTVTNSIRGSSIITGELPAAAVTRDIVASTIIVSGIIGSLTAGSSITNSSIQVTGPDGSINIISALNGISGEISASGPINSVTVTGGDLDATITTTGPRGNVGVLSASRDLVVRSDVSGNITTLTAGRNIGRLGDTGVILVRGNLGGVAIPTGNLYNDLRVGGSITSAINIGRSSGKPEKNEISTGSIIAFGRITTVTVAGDFGGDIISYSGGIGTVTITNGSFMPTRRIAAFDGSITNLTINNGNLYGNVHADFDITALNVSGGSDGIFGDVGVNPLLSSAVPVVGDAFRNQLPPGVSQSAAYQGPTITAGRNIVKFAVSNGNVYEATVFAKRAITSITVTGNISNDQISTGFGSLFAAGDAITAIAVTGNIADAAFIAGMVDLGEDLRAGGTGKNADVVKSGNIVSVTATGSVSNSYFSAGILAGADGIYNNSDDRTAFGISNVGVLTFGSVGANVSVFGDTLSATVNADNRFAKGGTALPNSNSQVVGVGVTPPGVTFGAGVRNFTVGGVVYTINMAGAGTAHFDTTTLTLSLLNTVAATNLTVASSTGTLNNFDIVTGPNASLGTLTVSGTLTGDSDIIIDGGVTTANIGTINGVGSISIGGDANAFTAAALIGGFVSARSFGTLSVAGQFGATNPNTTNEATLSALSTGAISITGVNRGTISVDRDTASLAMPAGADRALLRFGNSVGNITAGRFARSVISSGDSIGKVTITGDMFDSALVSGVDLGSDAFYGGTGLASDTLSSGNIAEVAVTGSFSESDIIAGFYRGPDGFYGTTDDTVAAGRSTITSITITGTANGSTRNTEAYRIASNGTIGPVLVGGAAFSGVSGNLSTEAPLLSPASASVRDIRFSVDARVFTANLDFNQPIDFSTFSPSLSVSEVRGNGDIEIRLIEGVDYTLAYDATTNTAKVIFSRSVTERNLPVAPDRPAPGVYRFAIQQSLFKAKLVGIGLDGNGDGFSQPGDNYSEDSIVGDAGDKINPAVGFATQNINGEIRQYRVDMYGATNLDFVMDANGTADNLPDINDPYILRGFIGDHPDNDTNSFRFSGDVDVYRITLQAGQILRLGKLQGTASLANLALYDIAGAPVGLIGTSATVTSLPPPPGEGTDTTFASAYLIKQTGSYYIVVGNAGSLTDASIQNPPIFPLTVGDYNLSVEVFDDGDTGFTSSTNAGDGASVVYAPPQNDFAGADSQLSTADDLVEIVTSGFRFTRDSVTNVVTGTNNAGIISTRDSAGRLTTSISASIGPKGHAGVPSLLTTSDIDVFHLNNRLPIAPGTKMRVTLKLAEFGADLGSASPVDFTDNRGSVQFALFDTSLSTAISDANLVFSPTDVKPFAQTPNTVIADNGEQRYGYDANGDFFIEFVVPDRLDIANAPGTFALYLQGVFNTDYQIEVVSDGTGTITKQTQNIFLETNGGSVDWLEVGGVTTNIRGFNLRALGFTGSAGNGQPVDTYLLSQLTQSLNSLYQSAGFDVRFSTNASDFEFQPFSTVYLTTSTDPTTPIFSSFGGAFNFDFLSQNFISTQPYGVSERSDPMNIDIEDDAVVFVPSFAIQGIPPSLAGLDDLTQSMTAAISRRVGELMGLRLTQDNPTGANLTTTTIFDPFAANSVDSRPGSGRSYTITNALRNLSNAVDSVSGTNFFLGQQRSVSLLDKVLSRR